MRHVRRSLVAVSCLVVSGLLVACGDDGPSAPNVNFPTLPQAMLDERCVRGNRAPPSSASGNITPGDCHTDLVQNVTNSGYYESWRVRVNASQQVTFSASSVFDNTLFVARVDSVTADSLAYTVVAENDDRSATDLNARIIMTLEPGIDYLVALTGFNDAQQGNYTLTIN